MVLDRQKALALSLGALLPLALWSVWTSLSVRDLVKYKTAPPGAKRVLWIGNSHTFVHQIPRQVQERLEEHGVGPVYIHPVVAGAMSFKDHEDSYELKLALAQGQWDLIVAQESSGASLFSLWWTRNHLTTWSKEAPVLFYQVWSHTIEPGRPIATPDRMQRHLDRTACLIEEMKGVTVSPVGHSVHAARAAGAEVVDAGGNHLAPAGGVIASTILSRDIVKQLFNRDVLEVYPTISRLCETAPPLRGPLYIGEHVLMQHWMKANEWEFGQGILETSDSLVLVNPRDAAWREAEILGKPVAYIFERDPTHLDLDRPVLTDFATMEYVIDGVSRGGPWQKKLKPIELDGVTLRPEYIDLDEHSALLTLEVGDEGIWVFGNALAVGTIPTPWGHSTLVDFLAARVSDPPWKVVGVPGSPTSALEQNLFLQRLYAEVAAGTVDDDEVRRRVEQRYPDLAGSIRPNLLKWLRARGTRRAP